MVCPINVVSGVSGFKLDGRPDSREGLVQCWNALHPLYVVDKAVRVLIC